jgi:hypothetical protein
VNAVVADGVLLATGVPESVGVADGTVSTQAINSATLTRKRPIHTNIARAIRSDLLFAAVLVSETAAPIAGAAVLRGLLIFGAVCRLRLAVTDY